MLYYRLHGLDAIQITNTERQVQMNKLQAQTIVSKENSIVWAMLQGAKGLTSIGKFRSIKKAQARCEEWADTFPNTRFLGVARSYNEMRQMLKDFPIS
jgi:hypothetical protein